MSKLGLIQCQAIINQRQTWLESTKTQMSNLKDFSLSLVEAGP